MVIHRDEGPGVVCVGQAAHAFVSGQLARAWGNDRFARPDPFDDVCLGAEQHDVGMAEWDLAPTLDESTGWPTAFTDLPLATHVALWRAAPRKMLSQSPYAALLVSMHGHALYASRHAAEPKLVAEFLAEQEAFQQDVMRELGGDPARARRNQQLVWATDFISLSLLLPWSGSVRIGDRELHAGRGVVDPWPFEPPALHVHCHGRRLERPCREQHELDAALSRAPYVRLDFELRPAG